MQIAEYLADKEDIEIEGNTVRDLYEALPTKDFYTTVNDAYESESYDENILKVSEGIEKLEKSLEDDSMFREGFLNKTVDSIDFASMVPFIPSIVLGYWEGKKEEPNDLEEVNEALEGSYRESQIELGVGAVGGLAAGIYGMISILEGNDVRADLLTSIYLMAASLVAPSYLHQYHLGKNLALEEEGQSMKSEQIVDEIGDYTIEVDQVSDADSRRQE